MSQSAFGEAGGVRKQAQLKYEKGERAPDASYLSAIANTGADVQYIVTGVRAGHGIGESAVHQAVLDAVDLLSLNKDVNADQLARAVVKLVARNIGSLAAPPQQVQQTVTGDINGIMAGRDAKASRIKRKDG
ncbi:MAG: helix-turn-helix transcriptional regulator [Rhodocyclaceae bacterium]|nr:helix-turn-helix transcriptional regulator [Rhodocyclaceae bacterium]